MPRRPNSGTRYVRASVRASIHTRRPAKWYILAVEMRCPRCQSSRAASADRRASRCAGRGCHGLRGSPASTNT
eukprot:2106585-Alexandrium_andersonii.AAC.1